MNANKEMIAGYADPDSSFPDASACGVNIRKQRNLKTRITSNCLIHTIVPKTNTHTILSIYVDTCMITWIVLTVMSCNVVGWDFNAKSIIHSLDFLLYSSFKMFFQIMYIPLGKIQHFRIF